MKKIGEKFQNLCGIAEHISRSSDILLKKFIANMNIFDYKLKN